MSLRDLPAGPVFPRPAAFQADAPWDALARWAAMPAAAAAPTKGDSTITISDVIGEDGTQHRQAGHGQRACRARGRRTDVGLVGRYHDRPRHLRSSTRCRRRHHGGLTDAFVDRVGRFDNFLTQPPVDQNGISPAAADGDFASSLTISIINRVAYHCADLEV